MTNLYKQNFLCNQRLWDLLNKDIGGFFIITTGEFLDVETSANVICLKMPFKEGLANTGYRSFLDPRALINRVYFSFRVKNTIKKRVKNEDLDLIHFFGQFSAVSTISDAKLRGISTVFTTFNPLWSDEKSCKSLKNHVLFSFEKSCVVTASKVIVASADLAKNYEKFLGVAKSNVAIVPNPVDTALFSKRNAEQKGVLTILCTARISPYKNQLSLVKAIPIIIKKFPNARFLFAGPISDSNYYKRITDEIKANNIQSNVAILGAVPLETLFKLYQNADVFVILSNNEAGLPQTCLEAMSSSLPIVVSDKPFFRQYLSEDFAFFVDPRYIEQTANAIVKLLSDTNLRSTMGSNAEKFVEKFYSFETYTKTVVAFYKTLIEEQTSAENKIFNE